MFLILFTLLFVLLGCAFWFTKTTKEMPKTWYEWKTEFRYQYIGMTSLFDDFKCRSVDRIELYKQPNRIAVITGGNRGIGLRIVEKLLACDMTVVVGVRNPKSAEEAISKIVDLKSTNGKLLCEELDVGSLKSVRAFAQKLKSKYEKIDILINNAGIMFAPYKITDDGYESHFVVNYLGHFLLQHLLMPLLKAAGTEEKRARIVNVSSCAHLVGRINYKDINGEKYYSPGDAYSQSKLSQILSTRHLQKVLDEENAYVQVLAVHPGVVDTELFEHSATTAVPWFNKLLFKTPEQGSRTPVYAAISPRIEGQGGLYLSNCRKGSVHPHVLKADKCERFFKFTCDLLKIEQFGLGQ
ncbi:dehydrogenase/reductase SDR family member on chromosome X [Musca vetustissima]|uniref:dehydrogenase/reductase SDR family member on chromosome X n=1 Tax=Musca vetustissima TaxID=27455 RepID=UPI002AB6022D|nr:dehydrogenase/reductase SDR family member on chromosome X [Musca vetustissima]